MKHPPELKTKFLELRARGVSYSQIAEAIGVSKPTLIQWGKSMAEEIADLQAAERELVREKLLGNFEQWLGRQVHHFNRLDEEFGRREFKYSPTESVFRMMMASRKLLDRYFFEDDRPSRRRASEGRAPSRPPVAAEAIPLPRAAETKSRADATGPGRDDGDSVSVFSADQSKSTNPKSEIESGDHVETQNPANPLPFPCQNFCEHNPALSSPPAVDLGRAACIADSGTAERTQDFQAIEPAVVPSALPDANAPIHPKVENPSSKIAEPAESESDFGGESVPISPFESTREWLERQGIHVSKIPKSARIITA
jgi:hypothetical protein